MHCRIAPRRAPLQRVMIGLLIISRTVAAGDPPGCEALPSPPDADSALSPLTVESFTLGALPGSDPHVTIGYWSCCVFFERSNVCTQWSVEPAEYAEIEEVPWNDNTFDPSIRVHISPDTPHGTVIHVSAEVAEGVELWNDSAEIHVYTREENPLVGYWRETARLACDSDFIRGDTDTDGGIRIADAIHIFSTLFQGGAPLPCSAAADANADTSIDLSDGIYLLSFLFLGGPPPEPPFPGCGPDRETMSCASSLTCPNTTIPLGGFKGPIQELVFAADGTFAVTWMPFETYRDYWGNYTHDVETGDLDLEITGGNFIPPDAGCRPGCRFSVEEQELRLENLSFGMHDFVPGAAGCSHTFRR